MSAHGPESSGGAHGGHGDSGHEKKDSKGFWLKRLRELVTFTALAAFALDLSIPFTLGPIKTTVETFANFAPAGKGHGGGKSKAGDHKAGAH